MVIAVIAFEIIPLSPVLVFMLPGVGDALQGPSEGGAGMLRALAVFFLGCAIPTVITLIVIWLLVTRLDHRSWRALGLRLDGRAVIWFLAMVAAAALIAVVIGVVLDALGSAPATGQTDDAPLWVAIISQVVGSAFLLQGFPEELLWRGWLFQSLGSTRLAGLISVVLFTIPHLLSKGDQADWVERVIYLAGPFGFAVAAVVTLWVSGSTWAAVGVHAGSHIAGIVMAAMDTDAAQPAVWLLEGVLWLAVAGIVRLLVQRGVLRRATLTSAGESLGSGGAYERG